MDTNNKEYQEALYDLCQSFLRFMRISGGVIPNELTQIAVATSYQHIHNISHDLNMCRQTSGISTENDKTKDSGGKTSIKLDSNQLSQSQETIIKYAGNPVCRDGLLVFNRLTNSPSDQTKYKIEINNGNAEFEVYSITGQNMLDAFYAKGEAYPEEVVTLVGAPKSERAVLKSTAKGKGAARGLKIDILAPCSAEYSNYD